MIQNFKVLKNSHILDNEAKKENEIERKNLAKSSAELLEGLRDKIRGIDFQSEEERMKFQAKLERKIKLGKKLSQKDMNYLRQYNPYMYHQMLRVQQKRESLKEQLKHCHTKEEAQQVMQRAFISISDKDPVREAMVAAVLNVSEQFRSSDVYKELPDTEEDLKKKKQSNNCTQNPFTQDEEDATECELIRYTFNSVGYQEAAIDTFSGGDSFYGCV